jgi:hypothetical protein
MILLVAIGKYVSANLHSVLNKLASLNVFWSRVWYSALYLLPLTLGKPSPACNKKGIHGLPKVTPPLHYSMDQDTVSDY